MILAYLSVDCLRLMNPFFNSNLNFDKVSTFRILLFKLFHIFIVEEIKDSLVEDSLQKGKLISFPRFVYTERLPIFTKTEILNRETGWELLSARRKKRKLQLFII
jgi:hypothetical protein